VILDELGDNEGSQDAGRLRKVQVESGDNAMDLLDLAFA